MAAQSGFRVFVTIRDRRNEIGGTWIHTGSFSLCATVIIKAAGLGSVHKRRFFSKYFSVPNFEDVEITGIHFKKITMSFFVISVIINATSEVSVISRAEGRGRITLTETLIIPAITKKSSNVFNTLF